MFHRFSIGIFKFFYFFLYYRWIIGIIFVFLQRVFCLAHVRVDIPNEDTTFYLLNFSSANYHLDTGDLRAKFYILKECTHNSVDFTIRI